MTTEECPYCHKQAEVSWIRWSNGSKIKMILCDCIPNKNIYFMNEPSPLTIATMQRGMEKEEKAKRITRAASRSGKLLSSMVFAVNLIKHD